MKIDQFNEQTAILPGSAKEKASPDSSSFSDVLTRCLEDADNSRASANAAQGVCTQNTVNADQASPLMDQVYGLLDTLEQYAGLLENSNVTLKQISPLVERMESQAQTIADGLNPDSGDDFDQLALQAVTQARVEAFKFQRGDYL